jgi:hypothetical protein
VGNPPCSPGLRETDFFVRMHAVRAVPQRAESTGSIMESKLTVFQKKTHASLLCTHTAQAHMTSSMCVAKTQSCDSQAVNRLNPAALTFVSTSSRSGSETGSPLRSSSPESDTLWARKDQASVGVGVFAAIEALRQPR